MAKQARKQAKAQPITANPLFPAVVALWFAALFGLGSLAVRPSLLENLVIKSRIDLIVPAAAPPLGVTARALVALILAAIGAALGVAIARRIARPKLEVRGRKRGSLASSEEDASIRRSYTAAQPRETAEAEGGMFSNRRRSLAIEQDERVFVPHDVAPLPGGAPQILDIAAMGFVAEPSDAPETPLELGVYAEPAEPAPVRIEAAVWQPAPSAAPPRQEFQPSLATQLPSAEAVAAAADGRQVFGLTAQPEPAPVARQIFGQKVEDGHVSQEFVKAAGYQTTVFDTPEPSPLFGPRGQTPVPAAPEPARFAASAIAVPAGVLSEPESAATPAPFALPPAPADLPELPSPAALGMTDLAARLAESMARRRAARNAAAPEAPNEAAALAAAQAPAAIAPEAAPASIPDHIPAALRPLELSPLEDDAEPLADLLPPRRIAMPEVLAMPPAAPVAAADVPALELTDAAEVEAEVAGDNYASLLGLAPTAPRAGFVRIEEPEAEAAAIEPVVIFPGQMVRQTAEEPSPFRRFDSPASAEHGQPVAANEAVSSVDRDEADRALRMALANLQRMSGAA